jgi:hypothetical protein
MARLLEQAGYLEREGDGGLIQEGFEDEVMNQFQSSSITYKIAVGSQKGRKVLTIKSLPSRDGVDESNVQSLAKTSGFSLHDGVSAKSNQRDKVERLCRYIARACGIYSSHGPPCGWDNLLRAKNTL